MRRLSRLSSQLATFKRALFVLAAAAAVAVPGAAAGDFEHDTGPCTETPGNGALLRCTTGYVGMPYQVQIESEEGSGCWPYIWYEIKNGGLPGGLSMTKEGLITGVPTGAGLARFWVWDHDLTQADGGPSWCQFDDRSEREFSIPVDPGVTITNTTVRPGTVGQPYSETLTARRVAALNQTDGPEVDASWSVQSGALPPGLTLSDRGDLSGTPTSEGSYQFVVRAANGSPFDTKTYTLDVRQPVSTKSPLRTPGPSAEVGVRFGTTFSAAGGSGTYTWSVSSGALPAGLKLDASTGALTGTPQVSGAFQFVLTAADSQGRAASATASLTVVPRLMIRTSRVRAAKRGHAFTAKLATSGGAKPLRWRLVHGKLPAGVRFVSRRGVFVGTPQRVGTFRVAVEARDALRAMARRTLVLRVKS